MSLRLALCLGLVNPRLARQENQIRIQEHEVAARVQTAHQGQAGWRCARFIGTPIQHKIIGLDEGRFHVFGEKSNLHGASRQHPRGAITEQNRRAGVVGGHELVTLFLFGGHFSADAEAGRLSRDHRNIQHALQRLDAFAQIGIARYHDLAGANRASGFDRSAQAVFARDHDGNAVVAAGKLRPAIERRGVAFFVGGVDADANLLTGCESYHFQISSDDGAIKHRLCDG